MSLRCVYTDLDGTLLGAGASMFRDGDGEFTLLPARGWRPATAPGWRWCSSPAGARRRSMEDARLIGQRSYIYEVGSGLVIDGEEHFLCGGFAPDGEEPHQLIAATGAPALLERELASSPTPPGTWTGSSPTSTGA